MGSLISSKKTKEGKIVLRIEMNPKEYLDLKGNIHKIKVFSENAAEVETHFSKRGTNDATKYFLIPKCLRKGLFFNEKVLCQKIEIPGKSIFVFVVEKS
jgi:hypothetical protein